ncbi:hypothetical protein [Pseudomonas alkylphenolica]|uniref:HEPN domain-containing protein n=1 Tax=Pseudomonas alkylphenolica TaxID=237609 RepID=A0A077FER8_9PSED|nr:hypothetical protein [Pseudomonas alkylphenolica]AIL61681.1 hypothetical protein PSAKL28_24700 [Pseudomonas alkylphenolica]
MQQHLTPWMIESAYRYLTAAKHLRRGHDMLDTAQINAALGMEILLKSFVSKPSGNLGQANETYELDYNAIKAAHEHLKAAEKIPAYRKDRPPNKHDLLTLFYAIPEPIRQRVRLDRHEHWIERYRDVFTNARYRYENGAPKGSDDILIGILDELVDNVVDWYRELGSQDVFIVFHGMPPLELPDSNLEPETL